MEMILSTKLFLPASQSKLIERSQLSQKLNTGLQSGHQVFLVSAPAGFGKTTCFVEWVRSLDSWPVAWLSLDLADDDPGQFFSYLFTALQKVDTTLGTEILRVMQSGQIPPVEIISTTLINDILKLGKQFLLVLDDFHVIQERIILQFMERLITNPPWPLHLALITREDPPLPIARLRAKNLLTEIRASNLRFTRPETEHFLKDLIGLSLSEADIATLDGKTEGWVVGLQLAGLSMRDQIDPSGFIANLSGSHRYILSYLTEEVLNHQSEETQLFLLQTSILDKLNAELCNTVTHGTNSHAILEQLFNLNLFLVPLDNEGKWYRYHHLFADLLRSRLHLLFNNQISKLHHRASQWYTKAGMANEAIQHAIVGRDFTLAVNLLEEHAMDMVMQGYVKTVNTWVQALPTQWRARSPKTNLAFAWMHVLRGAYTLAIPYLNQLEDHFTNPKLGEDVSQSIKAEWLVIQSLRMNMVGKITESMAMVEEAIKIVPQENHRLKSLAYFSLASAYQAEARYDLAVEAYQLAIQSGKESNNSIALMLSTSGLAQLAFENGQIHLAYEIAMPACKRIEKSGALPPMGTAVFGILGEIYYQWYQPELARRYYQRALQLCTLGGYNSARTNCRVLLSRLALLEGNQEAARHEIEKAVDMIQLDTPDYVKWEVAAQQVSVYLSENRPAAAEMALQGKGFNILGEFTYPELQPTQNISHSSGLLYNSSLRYLLYQARTNTDRANLRDGEMLADRIRVGALQSQSIPTVIEALLLRAQIHALLGNLPASQEDFLEAIDRAEAEGFIGVFIEQGQPVAQALSDMVEQRSLQASQKEFIQRVLAAFPESRLDSSRQSSQDTSNRSGPTALIEPLTEREREVLRLMVAGLKYREIAAQLVVSLNTVRYHVKAIYSKLNVNSRTLAIQKAHQLHIL